MKKKILSLSLSLLLILGLAACGNPAGQSASNLQSSNASVADSSTANSSATDSPTANSAAADSSTGNPPVTDTSTANPSAADSSTANPPAADSSTANPSAAGSSTGNSSVTGSAAVESGTSSITNTTETSQDEYLNIALFGLDANTNPSGEGADRWEKLLRKFRSDCIMIASINKTTGDVRLVSVYRDTFLDTGNGTYQKANAAYSKGGAQQAVDMLNRNLDLDIDNFMAISYHSLMDLIDGLGGIYVDVEEAALKEINGYQMTIKTDLSLPDSAYTPVTESGSQLLNGLQATAYCRLRHDFPRGDLDRAAHQRKVLRAIEARAKEADSATLITLFYKVFGKIHTNLDVAELLDLVTNIRDYKIAEDGGFPANSMVTIATLGKSGSCVVPVNLENNVIWLHEFLFDEEDYKPSQTVKDISATIETKAAPYIN